MNSRIAFIDEFICVIRSSLTDLSNFTDKIWISRSAHLRTLSLNLVVWKSNNFVSLCRIILLKFSFALLFFAITCVDNASPVRRGNGKYLLYVRTISYYFISRKNESNECSFVYTYSTELFSTRCFWGRAVIFFCSSGLVEHFLSFTND